MKENKSYCSNVRSFVINMIITHIVINTHISNINTSLIVNVIVF